MHRKICILFTGESLWAVSSKSQWVFWKCHQENYVSSLLVCENASIDFCLVNGILISPRNYQTQLVLCSSLDSIHKHHYNDVINERDGISNHLPHDCLLNCLFRHRSKKASKLHITGLCEGNSPVTSEFPAQRASNAKNVSIWSRHHDVALLVIYKFKCYNHRPGELWLM